MRSYTLKFNLYLKQWLTQENRGDEGNAKIVCLENKKKLLDEIKSIFLNCLRAITC